MVLRMADFYLERIGTMIRDARGSKGMTQKELAEAIGTSQSAVARIEQTKQNLSMEMVSRVGDALGIELVQVGTAAPLHLRIRGGAKLEGSISVRSSKNAGVALLCASLINKGRTM